MAACFALAALLAVATSVRAEVAIEQAADKSVAITTSVYTAQIDANGNLAELSVKGAKGLAHQFGDPGKPPAGAPSINIVGQVVAVRSGTARVEWTFGEDTVGFLTEGYNFECLLDPAVKAIVAPNGGGGALGKYSGGCTAMVLANDLTIASKVPMHVHERRFIPAGYISGGIKPGAQIENELRLGAPADAAQTLASIEIKPVGSDDRNAPKTLLGGGNAGGNLVHFPDPKKIAFTFAQQNLGTSRLSLEYRVTVVDHYVAGKEVASLTRQVTLPAETSDGEAMTLPELPAGFYYLTVAAWRGEAKLNETKLTFTVDLPHYARQLTRPADFKEFWQKQLQQLADTPMNPEIVQVSADGSPHKAYSFTLAMPGGWKLPGYLAVPAKVGSGPASLNSWLQPQVNGMIEAAKKPDWDPKADAVVCYIVLPEDATYTRWTAADDNNLLQCTLGYVRAVDYLATRPEVNPARIKVNGASRSGPLAFITAALRPKNVCAADVMIATSAGISWIDKPYYSWGLPGGYNPKDEKQVAELAAKAAYVDPVNHAPDVKCPFALSYGVDDTLSHPQGIEAMFSLSPAAWKRISRDGGGHGYSPGFQKLQKDLAAEVQATGTQAANERILKDH
ncbi:MAG: acetylxylan esterase [Planctomycetota bacterium]